MDLDDLGLDVFQTRVLPKCSQGLQTAINSTMRTKTPRNGVHIVLRIKSEDFPRGIHTKEYWNDLGNGHRHNQVNLMGTGYYLVERGPGYKSIKGPECLVTVGKEQVLELLKILQGLKSVTNVIRTVGTEILQYYQQSNRDTLTFALSGYLHKYGVPESIICDLIKYLIDCSGGDEESEKRFQTVRDTCSKDADTDQVSGSTKFLETVNGDESVIQLIQKEFGRLGYHFNGNGSGSSANPGRTQKPEEKKRFEYVQKYSNDSLIAEAIIIDGRPCFAVVSTEDGRITLEEEIPLDDSRNTVLKAPDLFSYINKPYSFISVSEFEDYIEKARNETLDSLYGKVKPIWAKHIDADDFHISLCAADTIFTYYQDIIGMTHYLFFIGDNDSGKSNNLVVIHYLAYRNLMSVGMSVANVYQFLGSRDEGVGTICEDEADDIDEDHDKMQIAKSGYTKGYPVTKIVITPYGRTQHKYNSFCFKAYTAERTPDPVKGKGFIQRIVKLQCSAGLPQYDILEVTNPAGDDKLQVLLDELYDVRKVLFCYCRLLHHNDKIPDIKLNLRNRENQLFKPVLKVFQGTKTFDELLPVLTKYVNDKRSEKYNSYHACLYKIVGRLLDDDFKQRGQNIIPLKSYTIWSFLMIDLEGSEIPHRPLSFESADFGTISQKGVTQTLIDVLGAKKPNRHGESRILLFDKSKFDRQRKLYNLDEIKIREEKEEEEDVDGQDNGNGTDGTDGTDGTHSEGVSKDSSNYDGIENEENREENNKNYKEMKTESNNNDVKEEADSSLHSHNVSHVSHVSHVKAPPSPINSNNSQLSLRPYKPPTGKNALDVWNIVSWANDKMGHCRLCQEIGEANPTRSQDRDRMFEHTYKRHKKNGWLYEVLRVENNNIVDVYHIGDGAYSLGSLGASEKLKAKELKERQTYWKAHAAPRDKIEETKKRASRTQREAQQINARTKTSAA